MALIKRGEVWHYDFAFNGERYRGTTGRRKKSDAAERVAEIRRELEQLAKGPGRPVLTLRAAAASWYGFKTASKGPDLILASSIERTFQHIDADLPVASVGPGEIRDAVVSRSLQPIPQSPKNGPARLPAPATVNRDLIDSVLRPLLNYCEETLEEPVRRIKWEKLRLKEPKGRVRSFTAEELSAWRAELPEWHRPLFDFIARYGVRLDEAFFPPSAVNVEVGEITLYDTKNGSDHALQILDADLPALKARKAQATLSRLKTIWYRDNEGEITPIHWRAFQSASKLAQRRAGITNAKPVHDLRHHAATTLLRATGNIKLVQDLLNHQNIASSARYAHTNKDDLRRALSETYDTKRATKRVRSQKNKVESTDGTTT